MTVTLFRTSASARCSRPQLRREDSIVALPPHAVADGLVRVEGSDVPRLVAPRGRDVRQIVIRRFRFFIGRRPSRFNPLVVRRPSELHLLANNRQVVWLGRGQTTLGAGADGIRCERHSNQGTWSSGHRHTSCNRSLTHESATEWPRTPLHHPITGRFDGDASQYSATGGLSIVKRPDETPGMPGDEFLQKRCRIEGLAEAMRRELRQHSVFVLAAGVVRCKRNVV